MRTFEDKAAQLQQQQRVENDINQELNISLTKAKQQLEGEQKTNQRLLEEKDLRITEILKNYDILNSEYKSLQEQSTADKELISKLQTELKEQQNAMEEKLKLLQNSEEKLKQEFENLALRIFEDNSKKFSEQNRENLGFILNPMKQQLDDFKKRIEDIYDKDTKERSALQNELKSLKELNQKISKDAINLTNALKGESKQQGIWGEMVLERVLEFSGLREGYEYKREVSLKDDDNNRYRPDVVVNLPENRHIIIDAKTSLSAYEQYVSANEDEKAHFLKAHLVSINRHIDTLAQKRYEELKGVNTLDFIFMFVPIESALMIALENDKALFDKAFKKKIILVSPTTLLVALKAVENSWRYEKQAQNTAEIVRLATKLYGKVRGFVEDLEKVGKHLMSAQKSYEEAYGKLYKGKDNLIRQVEVFKEKSNINPAKQLPQELIDSAMAEIK